MHNEKQHGQVLTRLPLNFAPIAQKCKMDMTGDSHDF